MFPMRDHLYELATAHELELMKTAQYEQQLQEAQSEGEPVWWLEPFRSLWKKLAGSMAGDATRASCPQPLPCIHVVERS